MIRDTIKTRSVSISARERGIVILSDWQNDHLAYFICIKDL